MRGQGEICAGQLVVTNHGLSAAANLVVKSSLPSWVFLREAEGAKPSQQVTGQHHGLKMSMVRHCHRGLGETVLLMRCECVCLRLMAQVGVSGTVFRVLSGTLAPGQSTQVGR